MATKEQIYFLSFCVEAYKMRHGLSGEEVLRLFDRMGVTRYLTDHCEVLHTQSKDWIVDDIDEFIRSKGVLDMNKGLTQDNLYLLLPGKVLAVAEMYARHHDVTLMDAMRKVYDSDMYKQLEVEKTKYWHLGPVALYQAMEGIGN